MLHHFSSSETFLSFVSQERSQIDCLIIEVHANQTHIFEQLKRQEVLLPTLLLQPTNHMQSVPKSDDEETLSIDDFSYLNHRATPYGEMILSVETEHLNQIGSFINQAIGKFLELSPSCSMLSTADTIQESVGFKADNTVLISYQQRLAEKLKERLGYLGVYYRRNSQNFLRNMQPDEKKEFLAQLKSAYREIILNYFSENTKLNPMIDNYVNMAFFADIPIARVVEIHMELMDEFSKQLKLEGRSEEILLDYRLTLIDTLANLCEMYRRSIPREL